MGLQKERNTDMRNGELSEREEGGQGRWGVCICCEDKGEALLRPVLTFPSTFKKKVSSFVVHCRINTSIHSHIAWNVFLLGNKNNTHPHSYKKQSTTFFFSSPQRFWG